VNINCRQEVSQGRMSGEKVVYVGHSSKQVGKWVSE
jgi:hypothetical protein